ncbi:MAG TPA: hypothetical protein VHM25_12540 [Polyangiaceae bacterium]|nr:hypothetical protein [Polyangiaceae bacterium]
MMRSLLVMSVVALMSSACGGSSDSPSPGGNAGSANAGNAGSANAGSAGSANAGGTNDGSCPDVSGEWTVSQHCESSLIGMTLTVTENACVLSFASPFDAIDGSVSSDGKILLSGPQSCTGTATSTSVSMNCTPDPCPVELAR